MRFAHKIVAAWFAFSTVAGCAAGATDDFAVTKQTLPPPAGAAATYVSNTLPGTWAPGERRIVTVTMNNSGTTNWTTTAPTYALGLQGANSWGWGYTPVSTNVAQGANHTFNVVLTAPNVVGITNFNARMRTLSTEYFGPVAGPFAQNIVAGTTPEWGCTLTADDVPTTLTPGEKRIVHLTVQNTGTAPWPASGMYVESRDTPNNLWVQSRNALPLGAVAVNGTAIATFEITAPTTPGVYAFTRELANFNSGAVGLFRTSAPFCVTKSITVTGSTLLDSDFVNNGPFPTTMVTDDVASVSVTMTNTGTEDWLADGNYVLFTQNSPQALWTATSGSVTSLTSNGASAVIALNVRAPSTPGSYTQRWQMRKISGASAGFFGDIINIPVTVTSMGTPSYGSTVASQTVPTLMTAGTSQVFSITMQNTGSTGWSGSTFQLYTQNTPANVWTLQVSALGAMETVAAGASRVFTLNVTAPATPGTYASSWRMRQSPGVSAFGATALTSNIQVTLCGNSTVNGGEECDDGNLVSGDGCDQTCQWEEISFDMAVDTPNRGVSGHIANGQVAPVTIGDISGDGVPEVVLSAYESAAGINPVRGGSGTIHVFGGGPSFFTDTVTSLASGAVFRIAGATAGDLLGTIGGGRIVIGEVNGDAISDLIVSAPSADGAGEMRATSGEVYVIAGSAGLLTQTPVAPFTVPTIDLGAMMQSSHFTAHIYGAAASDNLQVLATGDVTGDGTGDLILGAPGPDVNAAGAVYVVSGPVSGNIDLNAVNPGVFKISGVATNRLGSHGVAVGDIAGSSTADLLIGVPFYNPGGSVRRGGAFAFRGPITSDEALTAADITWLGSEAYVGLGTNVAIGNVTGTSANEAVITANQLTNGMTMPFGGATIWSSPAAGTYDMSLGSTPTSVIYGADLSDDCGASLALALMNSDSYLDIAFGCQGGDGPNDLSATANFGEAHVVLGAASLPAVYDMAIRPAALTIYGGGTTYYLGRTIGSLSVVDIDGDDAADICVGSQNAGGMSSTPAFRGEVDCFQSPF